MHENNRKPNYFIQFQTLLQPKKNKSEGKKMNTTEQILLARQISLKWKSQKKKSTDNKH
jgi:hypothetical protein